MSADALAMPAPRNACPGLSAPMLTGDGLLVRLLPTGNVTFSAFNRLCAAARTHGNGIIEITSRGSIQVRGLSADSAPQFAASVAALDIAADDGVPVHCSPLAGIDAEEILDTTAIAADLRRALTERSMAEKLSAKVSVAIDGGSALGLSDLPADIRLSAQAYDGNAVLHVAVAGDAARASPLGIVALGDGIETAVRLLEVIAQRGGEPRARDILASEGVGVFRAAISNLLISARPRKSGDSELDSRLRGNERKTVSPIGAHALHNGSVACGVGLAFGHSDATNLEQLDDAANDAGASGFRAAPGRTLLVIGLTPQTARDFTAAADRLGFVVRNEDPRWRVIACAGAPICSSGHIASRVLAPLVTATCAPYLRDGITIHLSGCAKGCAHRGVAALTAVGTSEGCALIANGTAHDAPFAVVPATDLADAIARYAREPALESGHV
jgi:precorrin-3B synthase